MDVILDGRYQSKDKDARRLVVIRGRDVWVRQKQFDVLAVLMVTPNQWVPNEKLILDERECLRRSVSRLRDETGLRIDNVPGFYRVTTDVTPNPTDVTASHKGNA